MIADYGPGSDSHGTNFHNFNNGFDNNPNPPTFPLVFTSNSSQYTPPCFVEGTRILTEAGETAVEALAVGDEVVLADGGARPVIWIGSRRVRPDQYPQPSEAQPVRVRAHAFGPGRPARDLRLSPGHAVWVDGVLIPVNYLINGATIVQEQVASVRYFHVELDAHAVLLAEGLECESYLEDGNRNVFANGDEHVALYGRLDPVDWDGACAPVLRDWARDGDAIRAVRARLHDRAIALGWRVETSAAMSLHLDAAEVAPLHAAGPRLWYRLERAGGVVLSSPAGRAFDVVPGASDLRTLGVAISALRLDGEVIDLDSDAFGAGFHKVERHGEIAWRWTDGAAQLILPLAERPSLLEVTLHMAIPRWARAPVALRLV